MSYSLTHIHGTKSILDGYSKVQEIPKRCKELGLELISISDHGSCADHFSFLKAAKKNKIAASVGIEFYICNEPAPLKLNRNMVHLVAWAKNKQGIKDLWAASSYANNEDMFYYKPRLNLWNWKNPESNKEYYGLEYFCKNRNIKAFSGHFGSHLSLEPFCDIFGDPEKRQIKIKEAFSQKKEAKSPDYYRKFLKENWLESTCNLAIRMQDIFGKGNFAIELADSLDEKDIIPLYITPLIVECLRKVSKETGIMAVCSDDPHYIYKEDNVHQRNMVAINMKMTEESIKEQLENEENDVMVFFSSNNFYIHSPEEMSQKFTKEELDNSVKFNEDVEKDMVLDCKPYMPNFKIPEFPKNLPYLEKFTKDEDKYLFYLIIGGAKKIQPWIKTHIPKEKYWERVQIEFEIISKFSLSNYFLVVSDICLAGDNRPLDHSFDWRLNLKNNGETDPITRSVGRGSAAGSIICYFTEITGLDPILYNLLFSRFLNTGRFTKDHIALPDIDLDFSPDGREWIIEYIKWKYGHDKVSQIASYNRIKGRNAIRDIIRIKNIKNGVELSNEICKYIPDEASIADDIQLAKEEGQEDYSIIQWTIDNIPEFKKFYDREDLKQIFDQAIALENVDRSLGKHPSGIIITPLPTEECFPMVRDSKAKQKIIATDYKDSEAMGGCKIDILGVSILSKLKYTQDLINK